MKKLIRKKVSKSKKATKETLSDVVDTVEKSLNSRCNTIEYQADLLKNEVKILADEIRSRTSVLETRYENFCERIAMLSEHAAGIDANFVDLKAMVNEYDEKRYSDIKDHRLTGFFIRIGSFVGYAIGISIVVSALSSLLRPFIFGLLIKICGPGVADSIKSIIQAFKG